jgi:very-short-patch-repair endonuclease
VGHKAATPDGSRGYRDRHHETYKLIVELDGKRYHPLEHQGSDQERQPKTAGQV